MLHTPENLRTVLDAIATKPVLAAAIRAIGGSEATIFRWLKRSAQGDEAFVLSWPLETDTPRQFVELVALARKMWSVKWEHQLRSELSDGIRERSFMMARFNIGNSILFCIGRWWKWNW